MATTGIIEGVDVTITNNAVQIEHVTDWALSTSRGIIDVTTQQSSKWRDLLSSTREWTFTCTAFVAFDATEGFDELASDMLADATQAIVLTTGVTGDSTQTGTGYMTQFDYSGSVGNAAAISITIEGTGAWTAGTS